jgi:hypothetical protein
MVRFHFVNDTNFVDYDLLDDNYGEKKTGFLFLNIRRIFFVFLPAKWIHNKT